MTETHDMNLRDHFCCVSFERRKNKTCRRRDETGFVHVEGKLYKGKRKWSDEEVENIKATGWADFVCQLVAPGYGRD